jgi:hypothetical protein
MRVGWKSVLKHNTRFNQEGQLVGQPWLLHDACLVASVLGDATK